jgi:DNA-binding transcriptional LysR family regulator
VTKVVFPVTTSQTNTFSFRTVASDGTASNATAGVSVKIDKTVPVVSVSTGSYTAGNWTKNDVIFTLENLSGFKFKDVENLELGSDQYCIILPKNHSLAEEKTVNLFQLRSEKFLSLNRHDYPLNYDMYIHLCENAGFFPNISSKYYSNNDIMLMVQAGLGISIMPLSLVRTSKFDIAVILLEEDMLQRKTVLAWKRNNPNPVLPLFLDICKENLSLCKTYD